MDTILRKEQFHASIEAFARTAYEHQAPMGILALEPEFQQLHQEMYGLSGDDICARMVHYLNQQDGELRRPSSIGWIKDSTLGLIYPATSTSQELEDVAKKVQKAVSRVPIMADGRSILMSGRVGGVYYSGIRVLSAQDLIRQVLNALLE